MLRLTLVCVGRMKASPERDLSDRYLDRARASGRALGLAIDVREFDESRQRRADDRKVEEATTIAAGIGDATFLMLDETGRDLDSLAFADLIRTARDNGTAALALVIGGPDGLDPAFRQRAQHVISFGRLTWPHQLVRVMASEQLYRAVTILAGHPYHRV